MVRDKKQKNISFYQILKVQKRIFLFGLLKGGGLRYRKFTWWLLTKKVKEELLVKGIAVESGLAK